MNTTRLAGWLVLIGALALAGCTTAGPDVRTDYDPTADFSRYSTFSFMERAGRDGTLGYETLSEQRVRAAITRELEARGYRRVDEGGDLLVNFAMSTEDVQDIRSTPGVVHPWYGWRGAFYYPWPAYTSELTVDTYQRAVLFVDLVDAQRRQLVWEGRAVGRVSRAMREDPAAAVDHAIMEIFARYPFRAGPGS
jgi:hypothetical protein